MRLESLLLVELFLTSVGFSVVPAMGKIVPQQQMGPVQLTQELRSVVDKAELKLFQGFIVTYSEQRKAALIKKIDDVVMMFEKGNFQGGYNKLDNDIAPKLNICATARIRALSWLSDDPEVQDRVHQFAQTCQDLIVLIKLADPRPTP